MTTKYTIAELNTKPSERWYANNIDKYKVGSVNQMSRISTGSRAKPKIRYSEKLRAAILNAM